MRIVHELYSDPEVCVSAFVVETRAGEAYDFHVEVALDDNDGVSVRLEGPAIVVLHALENAVAQIRARGAEYVAEEAIAADWDKPTVDTVCADCAAAEAKEVN